LQKTKKICSPDLCKELDDAKDELFIDEDSTTLFDLVHSIAVDLTRWSPLRSSWVAAVVRSSHVAPTKELEDARGRVSIV
jgi:hypothetical protein